MPPSSLVTMTLYGFGFLSWFSRGRREPREERLHKLISRGFTVELRDLRGANPIQVIEIDLRYGREYWAVFTDTVTLARDPWRVEQARLIVEDGHPIKKQDPIRDLGFQVERILVRFS